MPAPYNAAAAPRSATDVRRAGTAGGWGRNRRGERSIAGTMPDLELLARHAGWTDDSEEQVAAARRPAPGKVSRTLRFLGGAPPALAARVAGAAPVQRRATGGADPFGLHVDPHAVAVGGTSGGEGQRLPFGAQLQAAFGRHDLGAVRAHLGPRATQAAAALGAHAYARGEDVVFAATPDLFTAAHEAAHVVQQRRGVAVADGVGAVGDVYERHADEVAHAVVAGRSVEALLDAAPGGAGGGVVQRQVADPVAVAVGVPGVTREIGVSVGQGDWKLDARLKVKLRAPAAASVGGSDDDLHAELRALEPKLTTRMNGFATQLKTALVTSEFSLEVFEGIALKLKLGGPEATVGADGFDVNVAKVGLAASADVSHWADQLAGTQLSGRLAMHLELEGSFTIGGRLLAKLLEMDEVAKRLGKTFDQLDELGDELTDAARQEKELRRERRRAKAALKEAELRHLDDVDGHKAALRKRVDDLDQAIQHQRGRVHTAAVRTRQLQREVTTGARHLTKLERGVKGRVGKQAARRMGKLLAKRAAKLVAKFVPILNLVSTAADVYEVISWFRDWQKSGFNLPSFDGEGEADGEGFADSGAGGGDAGDGAGDAGAPGVGADAGADGAGDATDGTGDRVDGEGAAAPGAGTVASTAPGADAAAPHPRVDELVRQMRRGGGVALNREQVAAMARIVPRDLTDEQFDALRARLLDDGSGRRRKSTDPYDLLAMVDEAVRDLTAPSVTVVVDGVQRDDLAPLSPDEAGPVTSPDQVDDPRRNPPHGAGARAGGAGAQRGGVKASRRSSRDRGGPDKRDAADVTEGDVERLVTMKGGEPDVTRLVEWLQRKEGAKARGSAIDATRAVLQPSGRRWSLEVSILLRDDRREMRHFWLSPAGRRVRAEEYLLFDVSPAR